MQYGGNLLDLRTVWLNSVTDLLQLCPVRASNSPQSYGSALVPVLVVSELWSTRNIRSIGHQQVSNIELTGSYICKKFTSYSISGDVTLSLIQAKGGRQAY